MTLLVDAPIWPWRGLLWCHLVSDESLAELHAFARWIGVPARGFQGDHYDIPEHMRVVAIEEGAVEVTGPEVVRALYAAGLRLPPRQRCTPGDRQRTSRMSTIPAARAASIPTVVSS